MRAVNDPLGVVARLSIALRSTAAAERDAAGAAIPDGITGIRETIRLIVRHGLKMSMST